MYCLRQTAADGFGLNADVRYPFDLQSAPSSACVCLREIPDRRGATPGPKTRPVRLKRRWESVG